jgi:hypothetical protein
MRLTLLVSNSDPSSRVNFDQRRMVYINLLEDDKTTCKTNRNRHFTFREKYSKDIFIGIYKSLCTLMDPWVASVDLNYIIF